MLDHSSLQNFFDDLVEGSKSIIFVGIVMLLEFEDR